MPATDTADASASPTRIMQTDDIPLTTCMQRRPSIRIAGRTEKLSFELRATSRLTCSLYSGSHNPRRILLCSVARLLSPFASGSQ